MIGACDGVVMSRDHMRIDVLKPSKYLATIPAHTKSCPHCHARLLSFFGSLWKCPDCPRIYKVVDEGELDPACRRR